MLERRMAAAAVLALMACRPAAADVASAPDSSVVPHHASGPAPDSSVAPHHASGPAPDSSVVPRHASRPAADSSVVPRHASGPALPPAAASVHDSSLVAWLAVVSSADSARVMRLDVRPLSSRDSSREQLAWSTRIANQGRVGRAWIARFQNLVGRDDRFDPTGRCLPADLPGAGDGQLVLGIRFATVGSKASAMVLLREGCAELLTNGRVMGRAGIERDRHELLRLAREALPADTVVRHLLRDSTSAGSRPAATIARHPSSDSTSTRSPSANERLPKFGERVAVDSLPEAIGKVLPDYPDAAREAGVDGTVIVMALVGRDGTVRDVRIRKSIPKLDTAAMQSVLRWKFRPATRRGKPVAVWVAVPVRFSLH